MENLKKKRKEKTGNWRMNSQNSTCHLVHLQKNIEHALELGKEPDNFHKTNEPCKFRQQSSLPPYARDKREFDEPFKLSGRETRVKHLSRGYIICASMLKTAVSLGLPSTRNNHDSNIQQVILSTVNRQWAYAQAPPKRLTASILFKNPILERFRSLKVIDW